ncbi:MAG: hypothetical protein L6Q92_10025 [Phycisphaerae bacterium]|nr:hypothetical protein [Phycisphaerae bacterium]
MTRSRTQSPTAAAGMATRCPAGRADDLAAAERAVHPALLAAARPVLVLRTDDGAEDLALWQRACRIERLARRLAALPELADQRCDRRALAAAAIFHDGAWADDVARGRIPRTAVLTAPLDTRQRERSADLLQQHAAAVLTPPMLARAVSAIRQAADRQTAVPEAIVLAEAIELDSCGPIWLWEEFRRSLTTGRGPAELIETWRGHREYGYWEARIRDRLRFDASRRIARRRMAGLAAWLDTLEAQIREIDLDPLGNA